HRVPATLFVTTGFIGTDAWMWAYELEEMLLRFDPAAVARASGSSAIASICSARQPRSVLAAACVEYLKQVSFLEQSRVMHRLRRELAVEVDDENRFLSWDEVREIRTYGVEIGAHTVNHPILVRVPVEEAEREIAGSVRRLEEELGERPKLFAYPNGDTSPAVTALARRYFEAAVTTRDGLCGPDADLHEIPRIGAPNTVTELSFELSRRFVKAGRLSLETGGGQVPLTRDLASDWAEYGAVLR
ncbi:MAG: polysaccharide deacetylase family protein, partial [Myxococcales bacterium]